MTVAVASDHAGFDLKQLLVKQLAEDGHVVIDLGSHTAEPTDYPDHARAVGAALRSGKADRGVLICGSGVGACVAANKIKGVRAGVCHDAYSAHQGVEHDDMNVLCLGARVIGPSLALDLARLFLQATFSNEERHLRRVRKILDIEKHQE
ncbi:MAG: rpiB [Bacteroidetes bacterium]|nr:rpiB [Bacteroidota bacterium]